MARNYHTFDVIVLGGGTAGLTALKEVLKYTSNAILVNDGPLGTTCIRTACMPSKSFIHGANLMHSFRKMCKADLMKKKHEVEMDIPQLLNRVRDLREHFMEAIMKEYESVRDYIIDGRATFETPTCVRLEDKRLLHAKSIIVATGSSPTIPDGFESVSDHILTTDTLFEQKDLPQDIAVVGLGPVGVEMAQALARLGLNVTAINSDAKLAGLNDPVISDELHRILRKDMDIWTSVKATAEMENDKVRLKAGNKTVLVDKVLIATGRTPNLKGLGLERLKVDMNGGVPYYDRITMKLPDFPIYLAGDVNADRAILHEAVDEGKRAAYHAATGKRNLRGRKTPLSIVFTHPTVAVVGDGYAATDKKDVVTGHVTFEEQGRALIEQDNEGLLHVYAKKDDGHILGGEIVAPDGEHLAHLLVFAIEEQLNLSTMLEMPFYHPTVQEGLRTALQTAAKQTKTGRR